MKAEKIKIISVGPGNFNLLTIEAKRELENSETIICHKTLEHFVPENCKAVFPEKIISGTIDYITKHNGENISVLVSGDAGFFSLSKSIIAKFGISRIQVIPGISSIQVAFARLGESWQDCDFFSVHGRGGDFKYEGEKCAILCDKENSPLLIMNAHMFMFYNVYILEELTTEHEIITNPKTMEELKSKKYSSRTIVVLLKKNGE